MDKKIKLLNFLIIICFIIAIARSFQLQIINGQYYKRISFSQSYQIIKDKPSRGIIYDTNNIPFVTNQTKYQISLYKPNLALPEKDILSLIATDSSQIENFYENQGQKWITLKTLFDHNLVDSLKDIKGIIVDPINIRFYPENELAKDVLGFLAMDKSSLFKGYDGLEGYYNQRLTGKSGFIWQTKDATGNPILSHLNWAKPIINGTNIYTSLDKNIQHLVEKELTKALTNYQAESASAVIMNSKTGQIMAMSTLESTESATRKNRVITDIYEPGSIFKPLTIAIAIDSQSIKKDFVCTNCHQNRIINNHQIANWDYGNHPDSTIEDIIKNSDNIGMTYIMDQINFDTFLDYAKKLGLNQKSGIDLQGEAKPKFSKNYWSDIEKATASFGQGFAITNIQMLSAFNAIASDGYLVKPTVVDFLEDNNQLKKTIPIKTPVLSMSTASYLKQILKHTIDNSNLAKLNTSNMDVCGKSGTAQVAESGQYGQDTTASFIAFTPCLDPQYTMSVTIRHPQKTPWGATTAAPVWFSIAQKIGNFL